MILSLVRERWRDLMVIGASRKGLEVIPSVLPAAIHLPVHSSRLARRMQWGRSCY